MRGIILGIMVLSVAAQSEEPISLHVTAQPGILIMQGQRAPAPVSRIAFALADKDGFRIKDVGAGDFWIYFVRGSGNLSGIRALTGANKGIFEVDFIAKIPGNIVVVVHYKDLLHEAVVVRVSMKRARGRHIAPARKKVLYQRKN